MSKYKLLVKTAKALITIETDDYAEIISYVEVLA